jgi:hypothetical protein
LRISDRKLAVLVTAGLLALAGCAAPEQSLVDAFFGASRLRDTTALQQVSTVVFEPREQGIVRTFEITGITPERMLSAAVAKDVTVQAPVMLPDGRTVRKTIVITMQRQGSDGASPWLVVAFTVADPSPPVPPS